MTWMNWICLSFHMLINIWVASILNWREANPFPNQKFTGISLQSLRKNRAVALCSPSSRLQRNNLVKYWNIENLIHFHACTFQAYFEWLSEMKHCIRVFCQHKAFVIYKAGLLPVKLACGIWAVLWFGDLSINYKDLSHREPFLPHSVTVAMEALTVFLHVHLRWSWADRCLHFPHASRIFRLQENTVIFISFTSYSCFCFSWAS